MADAKHMTQTSARPWLLLHALDSVSGQVVIKRQRFATYEAAEAAASTLNPELPGNGWVLPNLPASAWERYGDEAYERGFYYAHTNRYAVVVNADRRAVAR